MYRKIGLLSFLLIGATFAQAQQTHIVDLAGTGDFTTIHAAVEAASAGDTIRVQPDQYAFTADLGPVEVDKQLVIIGSGYMPVEDGGTELVDIPNIGYFDLTGSADGTVIKGFRVQGASDFVTTETGTANITVEENLFIGGTIVIDLFGSADTVRSNIFYDTQTRAILTRGANTQIMNNLFAETDMIGHNTGVVEIITSGVGVVVAYNLFIGGTYSIYVNGGRIRSGAGAPEIYSNGFAGGTDANVIFITASTPNVTNNAFYNVTLAESDNNRNPVTVAPNFENFDVDNSTLDLDAIDEDNYDLRLASGSGWIDAGRTGTPYLDLDGSRSDIGLYSGPDSFSDGRGAPSVPVVIQFQVSPTTVSPSGTITITATGRIGDGGN